MSDLVFTPHPILKPPTDEEIVKLSNMPGGLDDLLEWHRTHEEAIEMAQYDPLNYGFQFPSWELLLEQMGKWMEAFAFGGNGSSKSEVGAWIVVNCLMNNPGAKIYCFAQDDHASKQIQQRYVHRYLPPRLRRDHKTQTGGYLKYTIKNGFTDSNFILDLGDGSEPRECYFYTYSQFQGNRHKFEGYEYGSRNPGWVVEVDGVEYTINCGAWLDEYLENGELYDTLLYRIPRRGSTILTTFTAIDHMTPFVASKIKASQVTKMIDTDPQLFDADKDEPTQVEWVREKRNSDREKAGVGMVFFPSSHNPWSGYENMLIIHGHKPIEERLVRFHGIPSNVITSLFPYFNTNVHVVDELPNLKPQTHTVYHVVDPAGKRSYVALWAAVDAGGYITVLKEYPERGIYGEWAIQGSPRWKYGPASVKHVGNLDDYVEEFKAIEEDLGVKPFVRIGDSRAFATANDDSVDRFMEFSERGMDFEPSDGRTEDMGLAALDDWFAYDRNKPVDSVNRPILRIHKSCGNLIDSILHYNATGKADEALKDFIDLLRYLRLCNGGEGPEHYGPNAFKNTRNTWGY